MARTTPRPTPTATRTLQPLGVIGLSVVRCCTGVPFLIKAKMIQLCREGKRSLRARDALDRKESWTAGMVRHKGDRTDPGWHCIRH
jgi:hypothetical protein